MENKAEFYKMNLPKEEIFEKYFYPRKREFLFCKGVLTYNKKLRFSMEKSLTQNYNK